MPEHVVQTCDLAQPGVSYAVVGFAASVEGVLDGLPPAFLVLPSSCPQITDRIPVYLSTLKQSSKCL